MIAALRPPLRLVLPRVAVGEAWFLLTMTLIGCFGIAASTIYVPSVPAIAAALHAPIAGVELTFASYLVVFALGMPVVGPLSDRYGRRRVLFAGLVFSIVGSVLCAASVSLAILIAARAVQAIGACAGLVVGRAVIRDRYPREEAARVIAGLSFTITLAQAFAPVAGSYLARWGGWRAGFIAVALVAGLALLLGLRHLPERAQPAAKASLDRQCRVAGHRALLTSRNFLAYTLAATGASAGFQLFSAGGAGVLVAGLGVSPQTFALLAVLPPAGFLAGSFSARRLTPRLGVDGTIACGAAVLAVAAGVMLALAVGHIATPFAIVGPMIFVCCGSGLLTPNAVAGALSIKPEIGGTASGLLSFIQLGGAAAATCLLSRLDSHSTLALSGTIALAVTAGIGSYVLLRLYRTGNALAAPKSPEPLSHGVSTVIIRNLAAVHAPDSVSLTASVNWEDREFPAQTVRFDVGAVAAGTERGAANAYLAACFPLACVYGEARLCIEGNPCPMLMEGLRTAQAWWRGWGGMPKHAPTIEPRSRSRGSAACGTRRGAMFLSGGVDSLHTLFVNRRLYRRGDPAYVRTAIVVHGFDIGKRGRDPEDARFEMLMERLAPVAAETGLRLVPCRTTLRHLPSPLSFWGYRHNGAALAAAGHATLAGPGHLFIASGNGVANDGQLGSHPITDGLFSSQTVTIVHDGARFSRLDKVRDLAGWPAALDALRVCGARTVGGEANCGRCEKCLRTRLELLAAGVEWTEAFGASLTPAELWEAEPSLAIGDCSVLYEDLLPALRERDLLPLVRILEGRIAAYRERALLGREWPVAETSGGLEAPAYRPSQGDVAA